MLNPKVLFADYSADKCATEALNILILITFYNSGIPFNTKK